MAGGGVNRTPLLYFQHTNCISYYDDVLNCDVTLSESKDVWKSKEQLYQSQINRWVGVEEGGGGGGGGGQMLSRFFLSCVV